MKCGTKTTDAQVFCDDCLAVMARYPVSPDTAVHLPKRPPRTEDKKATRKKEAVSDPAHFRGLIKWLILTVAVLTAVICLLGVLLFEAYGGRLPF